MEKENGGTRILVVRKVLSKAWQNFFETRIEYLEWFDNNKDYNKKMTNKTNKKRKNSNNNISVQKVLRVPWHMCCHRNSECTMIKALVEKEKLKKKISSKDRKYNKPEFNILVEKKIKRLSNRKKAA